MLRAARLSLPYFQHSSLHIYICRGWTPPAACLFDVGQQLEVAHWYDIDCCEPQVHLLLFCFVSFLSLRAVRLDIDMLDKTGSVTNSRVLLLTVESKAISVRHLAFLEAFKSSLLLRYEQIEFGFLWAFILIKYMLLWCPGSAYSDEKCF